MTQSTEKKTMKAHILTIGDEILIGQIVDTNSAWMADQLTSIGVEVEKMVTCNDTREAIWKAVDEGLDRADIVLITGGLGPTKDDLTKNVLADYFSTKMVFDEEVFSDIENLFRQKGRNISQLNREQAEVPEMCRPIRNFKGTAPGMWFERDGKVLVSMPGVPYEMKAMMTDEVLPNIQSKYELPVIYYRTVLTQGIPESVLAHKLEDWENNLGDQIKLAYLPSAGRVRLRLMAVGKDRSHLEKIIDDKVILLHRIVGDAIYGEGDTSIEESVAQLLLEKGQSVVTAESCTGGKIAQMFTSHAGSSAYFKGGAVTYTNESKSQILGVNPVWFDKVGAVSEEVVREMALGAIRVYDADWAVATSGVAGPDGGTEEKPVGTVWIAVAGPDGVEAEKFTFGTDRHYNINLSASTGLNMLRKRLKKI